MYLLSGIDVIYLPQNLITFTQFSKLLENSVTLWLTLLLFWFLMRKLSGYLFPLQSSRCVTICHAVTTVTLSIPVQYMLLKDGFALSSVYFNMAEYKVDLIAVSSLASFSSISFFIVDTFYIRGAYVKHHVGAIITILCSFFHVDTSVIHGIFVLGFFESGALLVQLSKVFPNSLLFRFFICFGYSITRLGVIYHFIFALYQHTVDFAKINIFQNIGYLIMYSALILLIYMNIKWCILQWKALFNSMCARYFSRSVTKEKSFFEYHQQILVGDTDVAKSKKL